VSQLLDVEGVSKTYESNGVQVAALADVNFSADRGEFIALVGPSGCGKSTMLRIIGDLLTPSAGRVTVDGLPAHQARMAGKFSYVFQNPVLLPWRNVRDNVALPLEVLGHRRGTSRTPDILLEKMGIKESASQYPDQLSGGMKQRAALARAFTFDPELLLMDEPFGAVDELTRDVLNLELLRIWSDIRVTVLLVTHSIAEAVFLADRVIVMSRPPQSVRRIYDVDFARPRGPKLKELTQFQEMVKCIREDLG
jgi:NitT/TauT family transport system ATP-binding protein